MCNVKNSTDAKNFNLSDEMHFDPHALSDNISRHSYPENLYVNKRRLIASGTPIFRETNFCKNELFPAPTMVERITFLAENSNKVRERLPLKT